MQIFRDDTRDPFGGTLAVPRAAAFRALAIGKRRGNELIRAGRLEVLNLGGRSKPVTTASIMRLLRDGVNRADDSEFPDFPTKCGFSPCRCETDEAALLGRNEEVCKENEGLRRELDETRRAEKAARAEIARLLGRWHP